MLMRAGKLAQQLRDVNERLSAGHSVTIVCLDEGLAQWWREQLATSPPGKWTVKVAGRPKPWWNEFLPPEPP